MKDPARAAIVGTLALVAVTIAAVTIDSPVDRDDGTFGPGENGGNGGFVSVPPAEESPDEAIHVPYLAEILLILLGLAALAVLVYAIVHWRHTVGVVLATVAALVLLWVIAQFASFPSGFGTSPMTPDNVSFGGEGEGDGPPGETTTPPYAVLLLLAVGLLVVALTVARSSITGSSTSSDTSADQDPTRAAVGRAAGRAADRIETGPDVDNEVYRAWAEMTDLLEVDHPDSSTSGEFAEAAIDAGLGERDVGELTRLFEDVRYGGNQPTDDYEARAVAVFRRIEKRYGEDP